MRTVVIVVVGNVFLVVGLAPIVLEWGGGGEASDDISCKRLAML